MSLIGGFIGGAPGDAARHCAAMLAALGFRDRRACGSWDDHAAVCGTEHAAVTRDTPTRSGNWLVAADIRLDSREELGAALGLPPSTSDGTLLQAALTRWHEDAFARLIGDWAIIAYNVGQRRLVLARDHMGQRPLFWWRGRAGVAACSMPSGLHALPEVERRPDPVRAARLLTLVPSPDERSFFADIRRVKPGHLVIVDDTGVRSRAHWRPAPRPLGLRSFAEHAEAYRHVLDQAVGARLPEDKVVAAHLSGGWDSGAVVATAAREGAAVQAYTAVPRTPAVAAPGRRFADESALAGAVAAMHPGIVHHRVPHPAVSPLARFDGDLALYDRPMVNPCNHVWLAAIRDRVRAQGLHVILTGEIGNFTISNAPETMLAEFVARGDVRGWARAAWGAIRTRRMRARGVLANSFAPWTPKALLRQVERFGSGASLATHSLIHPACRAQMAEEIAAAEAAYRPKRFVESTIAGVCDLDFGEYHKGVWRGWGIEKRDPTADVRVIEFMLSLPPTMFLNGRERRPLARAALADRLPPAVLDARGKGYQAADWHEALTADLDRVRDLIERIGRDPLAAELIDVAEMRRLVDAWPSGGWERVDVIARYRNALLNALSVGHFLINA